MRAVSIIHGTIAHTYVDAHYVRARADPVNTDHESAVDYNSDTSDSTLFASNSSCILSPEVTQGPYYVGGEYVREDVRDSQQGVELILDTQVVDVITCEPVTNAVVEIWHCNSTGVYSGVVASGNGVGSSDPGNLNNTFLRGLQPTDDDGVAKFTSLFPGHCKCTKQSFAYISLTSVLQIVAERLTLISWFTSTAHSSTTGPIQEDTYRTWVNYSSISL